MDYIQLLPVLDPPLMLNLTPAVGLPVQNLTAQVVWKRHGKAVLTTTQYVGYIGVHTGMRNDGWTVQANERVVLTPGPVIGYDKAILIDTAAAFLEGINNAWFKGLYPECACSYVNVMLIARETMLHFQQLWCGHIQTIPTRIRVSLQLSFCQAVY